jgi:hypothetical protein
VTQVVPGLALDEHLVGVELFDRARCRKLRALFDIDRIDRCELFLSRAELFDEGRQAFILECGHQRLDLDAAIFAGRAQLFEADLLYRDPPWLRGWRMGWRRSAFPVREPARAARREWPPGSSRLPDVATCLGGAVDDLDVVGGEIFDQIVRVE